MAFKALIVGLGNPGPKYDLTRHNLGFMAVDALLEEARRRGEVPERLTAGGRNLELYGLSLFGPRGRLPGKYLAAKPLTYMNLSGDAVAPVCAFYKLPAEAVTVLHDELDLPLGRLRVKKGGGNAGHRGLESISQRLGSQDYHRIRLGVGRPQPGRDARNYVLEKFRPEELEIARKVIDKALEGLSFLLSDGLERAMRETNGFDGAPVPPDAPV